MNPLDIVFHEVEGLSLIMPRVLKENWSNLPLEDYPNFCGAGHGWGERTVPDTNYGMSMRHNCLIHDVCFCVLPPTEEYWHISNEMLHINNLRTIRIKSGNFIIRRLRENRATTYFDFVESPIGLKCYLNRNCGSNIGQDNYSPLDDPEFKLIMLKVGVKL